MEIVWEDSELMVVNKPAGLVVNKSETVKGETMQDLLVKHLGLDGSEGELMSSRSGLAHRLDKETSGCLLVGKNEKVLRELLGLFKRREVNKEYLALVHGTVDPEEGSIDLPITRDRKNREKRTVSYEGKNALTRWKAEKYYRDGDERFSLVRLWPKTGRTHQIRVHMAHMGYSLFGDSMYLVDHKRKVDRAKLERHFLHAARLSFVHPVTGEEVSVEAQMGEELTGLLSGFDLV